MKEIKDLTKPILILDSFYHITTPNDDDTTNYINNLETLINESSDNTITCYTDGSRTESGVGPGFLTTANNSPHKITNHPYFKLPDFSAVFQIKVTAIGEVTTTILHNRLSTLQALSSKFSSSKAVILFILGGLLHSAHVGHWGNEKPDELAKTGTTSTSILKGYIPQSHINTLINQTVKRTLPHKYHSTKQT